jgi:protein involved in polysaccharide export with SLBB domain
LLVIVWVVGIECSGDVFAAKKGDKAPPGVSRELAMRPLPAYRIEPPDVLSIEMLIMVPPAPYRAQIYDVLQIRAIGTLLDQPIDGYFLVENGGEVTLGPAYGKVRVAGMTMQEAGTAIVKKLKELVTKPDVSVQLARTGGIPPVTGDYLVAPDGTVNLRTYGSVQVMGKTIEETTAAVKKQLAKHVAVHFLKTGAA